MEVKYLKDKSNKKFYPVTHSDAVLTDVTGKTLAEELNDIVKENEFLLNNTVKNLLPLKNGVYQNSLTTATVTSGKNVALNSLDTTSKSVNISTFTLKKGIYILSSSSGLSKYGAEIRVVNSAGSKINDENGMFNIPQDGQVTFQGYFNGSMFGSGGTYSNVMIRLYNLDDQFVLYAPTNRELYDMILDLQSKLIETEDYSV